MINNFENYSFGFGTAYNINASSVNSDNRSITVNEFHEFVNKACQMGCRHFDCAPLYGTQPLLGQAFRKIIGHGGGDISLTRSDLMFTSKLPVNMMREDRIEESLKRTLSELQLCYLDLFLVHAPFATKFVDSDTYYPKSQDGKVLIDTENHLTTTWIKMSQLKEKGLVKMIGLSNVNIEQLNRLNSLYHVDVVQNEFHLYNQDELMREECKKLRVNYEGFAALGSPHSAAEYGKQSPLNDPLVKDLALKYNKTPAQIIIYWLKTKELSYVIKSDNVMQLEENLTAAIDQVADGSMRDKILIQDEVELLDDLDRNDRIFYYDSYKGLTDHPEYPFEKRIGFTFH